MFYQPAELELTFFTSEDVITTSGLSPVPPVVVNPPVVVDIPYPDYEDDLVS